MTHAGEPAGLVTIEGIEGVGKSSMVSRVQRNLEGRGRRVDVTREPGGTPIGDRLRELVLASGDTVPTSDTELLLIFAARAQHLARRIRPNLDAGVWVVCDRFTDATYAYQGGGRGIAAERIRTIEQWVQGDVRPYRTVLLDAPVELALSRAKGRGSSDRFERETLAFFERARATYLERAEAEPERFRVVDASQEPEYVGAAVAAAVEDLG
jgi:dTMP kinase